jgi:hypothetical protein
VDNEIHGGSFPGDCAPVIRVQFPHALVDRHIQFQRLLKANYNVQYFGIWRELVELRACMNEVADAERFLVVRPEVSRR